MSAENMKFLHNLTNEQVHQLIHEGKIPDLIKNHRFKEILAANEMIDRLLSHMEGQGLSPYDIYYAMLQQTYYCKFAVEDIGQPKTAREIEAEIASEMQAHRKKFPPKVMQAQQEESERLLKMEKAKRLKELENPTSKSGSKGVE